MFCLVSEKMKVETVQSFQRFQTYRGAVGAILAGHLAGPQINPLSIKDAADDGNTGDILEVQPVRGVADYAIIRGSHQSRMNFEGDSMVVAATEHCIADQVPSWRHVNGSRGGRATSLRPCIQKSLGVIRTAVPSCTQIHHIVGNFCSS